MEHSLYTKLIIVVVSIAIKIIYTIIILILIYYKSLNFDLIFK